MSAQKNGGPAFARPIGEYKEVGSGQWSSAQDGMSLRDYFAAQALAGLLANGHGPTAPWVNDSYPQAPALAYKMADAMLAERMKP